jgi:hypothetical protein
VIASVCFFDAHTRLIYRPALSSGIRFHLKTFIQTENKTSASNRLASMSVISVRDFEKNLNCKTLVLAVL